MADATTLLFVVTDATSGAPLAGADVGLFLVATAGSRGHGSSPPARLLRGTTDAAGHCDLPADLAEDEPVDLIAIVRARGRTEWRSAPWGKGEPLLELRRGETRTIAVALAPGTTLAGRVVDEEGRAVAGAEMGLVLSMQQGCSWPHAFSAGRGGHWPPPCRSDADGRFEWLSFRREAVEKREEEGGRYVLTAEHEDFLPAVVESVETLPADDSGVVRVELVARRGVSLAGRVRRPDGAPAAGATIRAWSRQVAGQPACVTFEKSADADGDGRFELRGLRRLPHQVAIAASSCAPFLREVDLAAASAPLDVALEPGCDVRGVLLDRDGRPIARARVSMVVREPMAFRDVRTGDDGGFALEGLPLRGEAELHAEPSIVATVELPAGFVTLREPARVRLELRLVAEESGLPMASTRSDDPPHERYITLFAPGFSTLFPIAPDGSVACDEMPVGSYRAWVRLPDRAPFDAQFELREQDAGPIVLRVPPGRRLRGRVVDGDGRPIAGASVVVHSHRPGDERRAKSSADGGFALDGVAAEAGLVVEADGYALRALPVPDTGGGATDELAVTMRRGATVRGRVIRSGGGPVARVRVEIAFPELRLVPFSLPHALTDADGRFELRHVPESDFVVASGAARVALRTKHDGDFEVELRDP